jgi:secreted trypsin-like serine protease
MHGDVPYIVSLRWYGEHFCGGSILNDHTILTAGHCLYGFNFLNFQPIFINFCNVWIFGQIWI